VLGYQIEVNVALHDLPKEQHGDYKWFSKEALLKNINVHKHSKWYLEGHK
jgi:colanic acid biosynthesis protein WcaH